MFSFTFFFPFTVALSWSNPWLHCQDSSNEAGWCSEVICCNVVIICCWIINRAPSTIPGETTNTVEFEMSGRSPWWWWWRHQVRQLSRGWLSQTCPCSRKLHHRMIHSLSLFQSLMKYGWVESIFRWLWRQVNLRNLWGGVGGWASYKRRQRGAEWIVIHKRARAERRGEASPIRELGYAEKRRWPFSFGAEVQSLSVPSDLQAARPALFIFLYRFLCLRPGWFSRSRQARSPSLFGRYKMNKYTRWRTLPTQHSEGLAEARPQGPGAIFTLTRQHLPEQRSTTQSTFSQNLLN